jgi:hypothetical protein
MTGAGTGISVEFESENAVTQHRTAPTLETNHCVCGGIEGINLDICVVL